MPTRSYNDYYVLMYENNLRVLKSISKLVTASETVVQRGKNQITPAPQEIQFTFPLEEKQNGRSDKLVSDICQGISNMNFVIFHVSSNSQQSAKYELGNGFVRELIFPEMDISVNQEVYFTITYKPEYIKICPFDDSRISPGGNYERISSKNYRLFLRDVDCTRIFRIFPFKLFPSHTNSRYDIKFSSIRFVIDEKKLGGTDWQRWLNDFWMKNQLRNRSGQLEFLNFNNRDTLLRVEMDDAMITSTGFAEPESTALVGKASVEVIFSAGNIRFS